MSTKQELEAENARLRDENDALRAILAAIGDGMPPLPADPKKLHLYGIEAASRLSMATVVAGPLAACREDYLPAWARQEAQALRTSWAATLHYDAEHPDRSACACGHPGTAHIYAPPSPCTQCGCLAFSTAAAADGTPAPQGCRS